MQKQLKHIITAGLILSSTTLFANEWSYEGDTGPSHWGELSEEYHVCGEGKNQSPINIQKAFNIHNKKLKVNYDVISTDIVNNGHTVQVNMEEGGTLKLDGMTYNLLQIHFHTPSENNIHGESYPLEAHLVHSDENGNLAVVALMFEEGEETSSDAIKEIFSKMPMEEGESDSISVNLKNLVKHTKGYYRFNGSLTTPPCTEGVKWVVVKQPLTISEEDLEVFKEIVHGHNNRPVQPVNSRIIVK